MHTSRMVILHRFVSPFIQLLDAFGISDAKEANWDVFPVTTIDVAND